MSVQLRFEGDPIFEPTPFERLLREEFCGPIRDALNSPSYGWDITIPIRKVRKPQPGDPIKYFTPADQLRMFEYEYCRAWLSLGDDSLDCHLQPGHDGTHYDAYSRVEWTAR